MEGPPVGVVMNEEDQNDLMDLPPGFRFHPTDEEIIKFYLVKKVINSCFTAKAIGEVDLNKCEPWDLPKKAKMGEKEFFFFCQRDRKYPTGMRTNRATEAGYWKATGKDKEIYKEKNCLIGMKKTLVFYRGRAPKGEKTNWVTHEYRLEGKFSYYNFPKAAKEEWVVCRIFHKNSGIKRPISGLMRMNSFVDDLLDSPSLPPLMEIPYKDKPRPSSSYIDSEDEFKGTTSATATASASSARNSDDNYLSYLSTGMNIYQSQDLNSPFMAPNNYTLNNPYEASTSNSSIYSQMGIPNPPNFSYQPSVNLIGYQYPNYQGTIFKGNRAANCGTFDDRQCKLEQFSSNHSVVSLSQDTGLSTDRTTEISSVVSKQETLSNRSFDGLEGPSIGPISDFDSLWNI